MSNKISDFDYLTQLKQQYDFLVSDIEQYEKGNPHFAVKIASTLRTIFHNTPNSKAILPVIAEKYGIKLLFKTRNQSMLLVKSCMMYIGFMVGSSIMPRDYFDAPFFIDTDFDDYWNAIVYKEGNIEYTRKQLILFASNKWGGSHVDPEIPSKFLRLISSGPKLASEAYGEETIITHVVYQTSVQILGILEKLIPALEKVIVQ